MRFTNAELMQRKREGKELRGLKELRGVYVKAVTHDETKAKVKAYVSNLESPKRMGDIHVGGEILPEFNSEKWCKQCGAPVPSVHLKTCPTLKSKM